MERFELKKGEYFHYYKIEGEIGRGGLSIVYLGYDDEAEHPFINIALKIFSPDERFSDIGRLKIRFLFEQWLAFRFLFSRLLTGGYGNQNNTLYIKYTTVAKCDLKTFIRSNEKLTLNKYISIIIDILMGVSFLHSNGFIHRDLKPNNILLTGGSMKRLNKKQRKIFSSLYKKDPDTIGRAIVGDFGIARNLNKKGLTDTITKDIMGSRDYIAPEQRVNPREATEKSDIYSLGVIFYELIAKRLPTYNYERIESLDNDFAFLEPTILKMLESDPQKRFEDITQVANSISNSLIHARLTDTNFGSFISYPFKALLFANMLLDEKLNKNERLRTYEYPLYRIEDLVVFSKYWLKEPHKRLIEIHVPTFKELEANGPELVIKNDINEMNIIENLKGEIDYLMNKYRFFYDNIGYDNIGIKGRYVDFDWY